MFKGVLAAAAAFVACAPASAVTFFDVDFDDYFAANPPFLKSLSSPVEVITNGVLDAGILRTPGAGSIGVVRTDSPDIAIYSVRVDGPSGALIRPLFTGDEYVLDDAIGFQTITFSKKSYAIDFTAALSVESLVAATPEPATWAFMIIGFGAIGAAARRQAKAPAGAVEPRAVPLMSKGS